MRSMSLLKRIEEIISGGASRFYVPGHKGRLGAFGGDFSKYDITEIPGADSLYSPSGAIAELEGLVSQAYKSGASLISCGGSTLAVQAMLAHYAKPGSVVIMARNAHISAVNAAALLGFEPFWVYPDGDAGEALPGRISPPAIEKALEKNPGAAAVYITSPDYFGVLSDVKAIAGICGKHGAPLLIDNAHGAHLSFSGQAHPIREGADMCADSAHKTLPALTGAAFLHIRNGDLKSAMKSRMALFGSTSPSYLVMGSIDYCMAWLAENGGDDYIKLAGRVERLALMAKEKGFALPEGLRDKTRLTLGACALGYSAPELAGWLRENKIEPEYVGNSYLVLVPGPFNAERDFARLENAIDKIKPRKPAPFLREMEFYSPKRILSIREAYFSEIEEIPVEKAAGRILAENVSACPPGVPVALGGDKIDGILEKMLISYGVLQVKVVK